MEKTITQKEYHSISENIIKKGVESKITCNKIAYNMSLKEQESSSQVKQIYDKLIQENDYYTKIKNQRQLKTEQSQQIERPDVDTETKSNKVEDQNNEFESKVNITYTTENTEQNNRKYSTRKYGINNRVQNIGEIIKDKVPVEMTHVQTKTKQQDNDIVAKKTWNYQQQKEATGNGQRKEIVEKQSIVIVNSQVKKTRPITLEVPVQEQKLILKRGGKKTI